MKVTARTKEHLRVRRERRRLLANGYEEIGEGGGRLWELYRGARIGYRITEAIPGPDGMSVFVKIDDGAPAHLNRRAGE